MQAPRSTTELLGANSHVLRDARSQIFKSKAITKSSIASLRRYTEGSTMSATHQLPPTLFELSLIFAASLIMPASRRLGSIFRTTTMVFVSLMLFQYPGGVLSAPTMLLILTIQLFNRLSVRDATIEAISTWWISEPTNTAIMLGLFRSKTISRSASGCIHSSRRSQVVLQR